MDENKCIYAWAFQLCRPFIFLIVVITAVSALASFLSTYEPLFTGTIIDSLSNKSFIRFRSSLIRLFFFLLITFLLSIFISYFSLFLQKKVIAYSEPLIYQNILYHKFAFDLSQGQILNIFSSDISVVTGFYSSLIPSLIINTVTACIIGWRLFILDNTIFYTSFVLSCIPIVLAKIFGTKQAIIQDRQKRCQDEYFNFLNSSIEGIREIHNARAEHFFRKSLSSVIVKMFKTMDSFLHLNIRASSVGFIVNSFTSFLIFFIIGLSVLNGTSTLGNMVAAIMYTQRFRSIIQSIAGTYQTMIVTKISVGRLYDICHKHKNTMDKFVSDAPIKHSKGIYLKDYSFAYDEGKKVINHVGFSFTSPGLYVIKGRNGCGKTTLLNIFSSNLSTGIATGEIEFCGISPKTHAYIQQKPVIFPLSLKHNILLGRKITDSRYLEILRLSGLDEIVGELPLGDASMIGDLNNKLSQGQYQRVSLARCLAGTNTEYYLFDEVEKSFDKGGHMILMQVLRDLAQSKLVIIVTHSEMFDQLAASVLYMD